MCEMRYFFFFTLNIIVISDISCHVRLYEDFCPSLIPFEIGNALGLCNDRDGAIAVMLNFIGNAHIEIE